MALCSQQLTTPLGRMFAVADDRALVLCEFHDRPMLPEQLKRVQRLCKGTPEDGINPILEQTQKELNEYFLGQREQFSIPLNLDGTPWQTAVWYQLLQIPFGKTISYDWISGQLGQPNAVRAVARANGDNRIAIIVPCHRVIGSSGSLTGYGGGLHRKSWLLDHERRWRTDVLF